jgi:hypothetical protein
MSRPSVVHLLALAVPRGAVCEAAGAVPWILLVAQALALGVSTPWAERSNTPGLPILAPASEQGPTDLTGLTGVAGHARRSVLGGATLLALHADWRFDSTGVEHQEASRRLDGRVTRQQIVWRGPAGDGPEQLELLTILDCPEMAMLGHCSPDPWRQLFARA